MSVPLAKPWPGGTLLREFQVFLTFCFWRRRFLPGISHDSTLSHLSHTHCSYHSRPSLAPHDPTAHTALADVRASLATLKFYRATVFQRDGREVRRAVVRTRQNKK